MKISIINGPNLNLLGTREPTIYGGATLDDIEEGLGRLARDLGVSLDFCQHNSEGELVDAVQRAGRDCEGIVLNPAAYTHYGLALRDAVAAVGIPTLEVHISNVFAREEFRARSVIAPVCAGGVWGMGTLGYRVALSALVEMLRCWE
ncbi:MAG: type II 3-dehydroquinate dehydratase [Bacillota bacterium]